MSSQVNNSNNYAPSSRTSASSLGSNTDENIVAENIVASASLVLGALGIATVVLLPLWGSIPLSIAAVVLGIIGRRRVRQLGGAHAATAGLVMGGVGSVASLIVLLFLLLAAVTRVDTAWLGS